MPHSPTPWVFKEADGDEIIEDANGRRVHYDTQYYPSGLDSDDARFIVRSVNRVAELEVALHNALEACRHYRNAGAMDGIALAEHYETEARKAVLK